MRFPSFLIPITLLLFASSTYAGPLSYANWSNPVVTSVDSDYCCIPTSIEIACPSSYTCTAKYEYPESLTSRCYNLFKNPSKGELHLEMLVYEGFLSDTVDPSRSMQFSLSAYNTTGSPRLRIRSVYGNTFGGCNFNMTTRKPRASSSNSNNNSGPPNPPDNSSVSKFIMIGDLIVFLCILAILGCCFKFFYKRQENINKTQNIALSELVSSPVQTPQQQYVQPQPQSNYAAPNQFIPSNVQVGVNSNGNNVSGQVVSPNVQVNMNYGGPGQYPNPQMNVINYTKKPGIVNRSEIV